MLSPHPYTLRHGGASDDALRRRRTWQGIQDRGRWKTAASVRRYKKFARVMKEAERLSQETRNFGLEVEKRLTAVLLNKVSLRPPLLDAKRLRAAPR